jgi:mono/diheme cytochrome c family protein
MNRLSRVLLLAGLLAWSGPLHAAHPVVPGFERFSTGKKADPAQGGQLLLGELNCVSCHQTTGDAVSLKQAPVLDRVGTRVRISYMRKFLTDPQAVKPGTTMPAVFAGDPARQEKVEALVHYLASTGALPEVRPSLKAVALGRDLYSKVGCVACHGSRQANGDADKVLPFSAPLGDLKTKYSLASLAAFLQNPHQVRPSGRMPRLLNTQEAMSVANYLLQGLKYDLKGKGTTTYAYYEGDWDRLPDFSKLKPKAKGIAPGFDVSLALRGGNYALLFEGYIRIEREAVYRFNVGSDDGSRLLIDGKLVVDNDGVHAPKWANGRQKLTKGVHKVRVEFFQGGGGAELEVFVESRGLGRQKLGDLVASSEKALDQKPAVKNDKNEDALEVRPELVAKGKLLFASAGCASCHQMTEQGKRVASTLTAPALAKMKPEGGCLADTPARGLPSFSLSPKEMTALSFAIKFPPAAASKPSEVIARTMTTFNCYACHQRDKVGGAVDEMNKFFLTTQPEMGDEGRVPPPLDGVGAKLKLDYFSHLLDAGAHDRPYMMTRMPGFGSANVGHLPKTFASIDKLPEVPKVSFKLTEAKVRSTARHLIGAEAFGCIKCHTFAGQKAEGVQGIDMKLMPKRLTHEWFHAYVLDPQKIRPGTRMPAGFVDGKSVLPGIMGGDANRQIEAMWEYLSDAKSRPPVGMLGKSIPLVPTDGAIIYRNFIQGAGPRGIAVGYPERVSLAFDANELRLAMIWQGAFMDAAHHWTDRGAGYEGPLGDNILHLTPGPAFAFLKKADEAWPNAEARKLGYHFLGYKLTPDDRPTLRYSLGDVTVEDFPNGVAGKDNTLLRKLTLTASKPTEKLYFRPLTANKIETLANGWFRIDGTWKLKAEGATPQVRQSAGKAELLLPVVFKDGKATVSLEYVW